MKNTFIKSGVVFFGLFLLFTQCDKVEDPYAHLDDQITVDDDSVTATFNDTFYSDDTRPLSRRVLLEDFTGMKCNNCPRATDVGKDLIAEHGDKIVFVALHNSGAFSQPDDDFPLDLETETGENLRVRYQIASFPMGMLNRTDYENSGTERIGDQNWENVATQMLSDANYIQPNFDVSWRVIYNTRNRVLRILPRVECLTKYVDDITIHAYILEDDITGPQIDSRASKEEYGDKQIIPNYFFKYVVRAGFPNLETGRTLFSAPSPGEVFEVQNPEEDELRYNIADEWNDEKLSVVLYFTDAETGQVVFSDKMKLF